jgi:hypothetical protein
MGCGRIFTEQLFGRYLDLLFDGRAEIAGAVRVVRLWPAVDALAAMRKTVRNPHRAPLRLRRILLRDGEFPRRVTETLAFAHQVGLTHRNVRVSSALPRIGRLVDRHVVLTLSVWLLAAHPERSDSLV